MKKIILVFVCVINMAVAFAQSPSNSQTIDLLKAPASPVAQLLNFAPTAIEKPTDLTSFWLSVKNSTSDLTKLPNCYALDLSLAEIFKSSDLALSSLSSTKPKDVLWQ